MKLLVVFWKLARAVIHTVAGFATIVFIFPRRTPAERYAIVQDWSKRLLQLLGIDLALRGQPPVGGPVLLVSNHISWLDIAVMHAARHCRFVSKSEVRHWPMIGTMATGAGTLYIERESRRDAMRVVHRMAESLQAGDILAVFPEGTTSNGVSMLPFHGNLIQAAITAQVPVQPVALSFIDVASGLPSLAPCYIDDQTLLGSIWRTLTGPRLTAVVSYGVPQLAAGRDRRAWAADLREAVGALRKA